MSAVYCLCGYKMWSAQDGLDRQCVGLFAHCLVTNDTRKSPHYDKRQDVVIPIGKPEPRAAGKLGRNQNRA